MEERERIPNITAMLMISVAFMFDGVQGLLTLLLIGIVLNPFFITPLAWLTFYLWFKIRGISLSDSLKRMATMFVAGLIEIMPFLNVLPAWTLSTFAMVVIVKAEDKAHNAKVALWRATQAKLMKKMMKEKSEQVYKAHKQEEMEKEIEREEVEAYNKEEEGRQIANNNERIREQLAA